MGAGGRIGLSERALAYPLTKGGAPTTHVSPAPMIRSARFLSVLLLALASTAPTLAGSHFNGCERRTGSNATLIVPAGVLTSGAIAVRTGAEIALFTPEGTCAGHAVWKGGALALAVWEDDPQTEARDGFLNGEAFRLALWDAASDTEYADITPSLDPDFADEPVFAQDAVYLVSALDPGDDVATRPLAFGLEPNFPNPFAAETTIRYELEESARVELAVYNVLGQRVAALVDERQQPGRYQVAFRPPANLASGTYLYRLVTDRQTAFRRMTLVR